MRGIRVAAAALSAATGALLGAAPRAMADPAEPPAPPAPRRRLESVQLGVAHHAHHGDVSTTFGNSPTLSLETGAFLDPALGISAFVRGQRYTERAEDFSAPRGEILAGARLYFQPPGRLLAAFGAGVIATHRRRFGESDHEAQKFVEVYLGYAVLRSRCTDLEAGAAAGYSPDEEYAWFGLAIGARRRIW